MTTISERNETATGVRDLPDGWQWVKFGEVVRNVDVSVRNPLEQGIERYLGLEHIDPESLRIKRWGLIAEGITFTRKFVPGQVLFGKRRAYQRKVAVAEFEGICSGDILVFEPANHSLIAQLLPFIVQSEGFFQHALGTSAGSLSPRTRWRDLAAYEFALPPIDEQRRIAEILWAAEEAIVAYQDAKTATEASREAIVENVAQASTRGADTALDDILLGCQYGTSIRSGQYTDGAVPILRIPNVVRGQLERSDLNWIVLSTAEQGRFSLHPQDILLVRTNGNSDYVGRCCVVEDPPEGAVYASYLIRLQVDKSKAVPEYVAALINSQYLRRTLRYEIRSSAGNYNINTVGIRRQRIPLPSLMEQQGVATHIAALDDARERLLAHIERLRTMKRAVLNSMAVIMTGEP